MTALINGSVISALLILIWTLHSYRRKVAENRELRGSRAKVNADLKKAEEVLDAEKGCLGTLLENVKAGVMAINGGWRVSAFNGELKRMFGTGGRKEVLGKDFLKIFPDLVKAGFDKGLLDCLLELAEKGGSYKNYDVAEKGKIYNYSISVLRARRGQREIQNHLIIVHDISERKQLEEERDQSRKALEGANRQLREKIGELASSYEGSQKTYFDTIRALAMAIEARDAYTRGHSERITHYALDIAQEMGLSSEETRIIQYGGRLHDIGKIGIPDAILGKPARLTVAEMAEIKLHPGKGADMLEPIDFLKEAVPSVRHHHERFDGRGYPHSLAEDKIPLLARILAIADAFDAMTSKRPYREALSPEEAMEELKSNMGKQFDPEVTRVFLRVLEKEK